MLVSHHPEPTMGDQGVIVLKSGNIQTGKFSVTFDGGANYRKISPPPVPTLPMMRVFPME